MTTYNNTVPVFQSMIDAEKYLLSQEISIPVYFAHYTHSLAEIYNGIKESTIKDSASSAAQGKTVLLIYGGFSHKFFTILGSSLWSNFCKWLPACL